MTDYPETADQWWTLAEEHKKALLNLVAFYHPFYHHAHQHQITAEMAEKACVEIRKEIAEKQQKDPERQFEQFLRDKNTDLVHLLNEVWFGMPESNEVRSEPGFNVLCDLCSEAYVLDE